MCSFCEKHKNQVETLIAGSECYVCNECVDLCYKIIHDNYIGSEIDISGTPTPSEIKEVLDESVIGQDFAKEVLSVAVYNHYKRLASNDNSIRIDKSNIMMLGPSGTGKTLIAKTISEFLHVPFAQVDSTSLTESGYVGDDVENIIQRLLVAADFDVSMTERGIIFIDEVDKKTKKGENISITKDVSGEGVQQALLKIVEGTVVRVPPEGGRKHPGKEMIEVDTRNILFICAGAFIGLDDIVRKRMYSKAGVGFGSQIGVNEKVIDMEKDVRSDDIIQYGIIPELMGRFPVTVGLKALNKDDLMRILIEPKHNIISQFKHLFSIDGIELIFDDSAIEEIANVAIKSKTGARELRSIVERALHSLQFNLPTLAAEGVKKIIINDNYITTGENPILIHEKDEPVSVNND